MIVCQSAPPDSKPAPRLIARSMLSAGMELFLAFATASNKVGLPTISAPPVRAATSIALTNLTNDFARRESIIAFLCLVVAHLEWPDIYTSNLNRERKLRRTLSDLFRQPCTLLGQNSHECDYLASILDETR